MNHRRGRLRATRLLLPLLACNLCLWSLLPLSEMRQLVPWAGGTRLMLAGLSLGCVVRRVYQLIQSITSVDGAMVAALAALRRACMQMAFVLLSMLLVIAGYWMMSSRVLAKDTSEDVVTLLWALPMGGLVLSVYFADLVSRAVDVIEIETIGYRVCSR